MNIKDANTNIKTNGFTIIEVVLVLAIAGLIFLIVFIALPGLQATRRDHQRKTAAVNLMAKVTQQLHFPQTSAQHTKFLSTLDDALYVDPSSGTAYDIPFRDPHTSNHTDIPNVGQIFYLTGHQCTNSPGDIVYDPSVTFDGLSFAVIVGLEVGQYTCYDNASG